MNETLLKKIICNNALWCDKMYRAHGRPGIFTPYLWFNPQSSLPFYPNAITLTKSQWSEKQLKKLQQMTSNGPPGEWTIKDSYCNLDLTKFGFQPLFEAMWIYRDAHLAIPVLPKSAPTFSTIQTDQDLAHWENAWAKHNSKPQPRLFLPSLLEDDDIAIIGAYENEEITAGAIVNRSGIVMGISNIFTPTLKEPDIYWTGIISMIMQSFPGIPMVDYESGESLKIAKKTGFNELAPLRIWLCAGK